jgi:orotidine-5'-phosphate decarboxylase
MSAKTINYINENYPEIFTIADAKRGIGNVLNAIFFEDLNFDSYCSPTWERTQWSLLAFENKHTIMLALTSNEGAFDFQNISKRENYISKSFRNVEILEK